jgi:hypothetical protein
VCSAGIQRTGCQAANAGSSKLVVKSRGPEIAGVSSTPEPNAALISLNPALAPPQMSVDDLVARHIDPDTPPRDWRLVVPWTGSGGPHQALSERQLLEVNTFVSAPFLLFGPFLGLGAAVCTRRCPRPSCLDHTTACHLLHPFPR